MEHQEQALLVSWIKRQYPDVLFHANINGAHLAGNKKARAIQINKLKAEGMINGVPDIFVAEPRAIYNGCYIEMKSKDGELSESQIQFLGMAKKRRFFTIVAYSFEGAKEKLENYLNQ